ncbi:RING membrane-anchor 1, putative isoform 2 [Hibiscus syriacus]|uniref:E3 ubiquitin-protein ligase RMA n=1 Tax=Hibiscus syriacus TaxID=106335 RepID=A0A6A2YBA3_HIBSY|nr:E3 ubiquitin-protein ligase RMA1H1-like [Hibiscus syriacus]KAE8669707.1 RING membrane-anchor 1, putative isoform 2 [Hibiscus syriacus]
MNIEQNVDGAGVRNRSPEGKDSMEKWMNSPEAVTGSDDSTSFNCNICLDTVQDPVVTLCGHIYCWPCIYRWLQLQSNSTENQTPKQPQCPVCKANVSDSTLVPLYGRGQTSKGSKSMASQLGVAIPKRPLGPDLGIPRTPNTAISPQFAAHQMHHYPPSPMPSPGGTYSYQPQVYDYPPSPMRSPGGPYSYQPPVYDYLFSPVRSPGGTTTSVMDPLVRMLGETVHTTRVFGDLITNLYAYPNSYNLVGSTSPRIRRHIMRAYKSLDRFSFFLFCCMLICLLLF